MEEIINITPPIDGVQYGISKEILQGKDLKDGNIFFPDTYDGESNNKHILTIGKVFNSTNLSQITQKTCVFHFL